MTVENLNHWRKSNHLSPWSMIGSLGRHYDGAVAMIVRTLEEIAGTDRDINWGNGQSRRFLVERDGMGFALMETLVLAGTFSFIQYRNHLEACYCIEGEGEIEDTAGNRYPLRRGTLYALDRHDAHYLRARTDMRLVSVFNPPLRGDERHTLQGCEASAY